jgi:hypothetical protein
MSLLNFRLRVLSLILFAPAISAAATISVVERGDYKYPIISIRGEITNADGDRFSTTASQYSNALVEMDSPGGSLLSSMQIGTIIRLRAFNTLVRNGSTCASACAYAWLAGIERFAEPEAKIGFHAAYVVNQGVAKETGVGNALLGSYLSRIALSDAAIVYFTSAAPQEMNWLTGQTANRLGLNLQNYSSVRKTPSAPPSTPTTFPKTPAVPTSSSLELATAQFVKKYFSYWSTDNQLALQFLEDAFDENVDFYGASRAKRDILKEKMAMIKRWPARAYIERPGSIKVACSQIETKCRVSGLMDWEVKSEARNAVQSGLSEFAFILDYSRGTPKIVSETGSVLERKKN